MFCRSATRTLARCAVRPLTSAAYPLSATRPLSTAAAARPAAKCAVPSAASSCILRALPRAAPTATRASSILQSIRFYARQSRPVPKKNKESTSTQLASVHETVNYEVDVSKPSLRERVWDAGMLSGLDAPPTLTAVSTPVPAETRVLTRPTAAAPARPGPLYALCDSRRAAVRIHLGCACQQ